MQGQSAFLTVLDASMDVTVKLETALNALRRLNGMLEQAAKQSRLDKRQARGQ